MSIASLLVFVFIGLIAGGWAGVVMKGGGLGLIGNITIGMLGALITGILVNQIGLHTFGFNASVIGASLGAILLIQILRTMTHTSTS